MDEEREFVRERNDSRFGVPMGELSEDRSMNIEQASGEEVKGSIDCRFNAALLKVVLSVKHARSKLWTIRALISLKVGYELTFHWGQTACGARP